MPRGALNVLIVHGIGGYPNAFPDEFRKELLGRISTAVEDLVRRYRLPAALPSDTVNIIPGRWGSVTEALQEEVERRIFREKVDFLRWFGMRIMGDVVAYRGPAVYEEVHRALAEDLRNGIQPESGHLTVVAHSLGAVVASDFLYDHTLKIGRPLADTFGVAFSNFFTFGSPLVLYAMQSPAEGALKLPTASCGESSMRDEHTRDPVRPHPAPRGGEGGRCAFDAGRVLDRFDRPVRVESPTGVWMNVFDDADIIGYPIRAINQAHTEAVTADVCTGVGTFLSRGNPLSHGRYWSDRRVVQLIAEKLAIDLAELHMGLEGPNLRQAVADYVARSASPSPWRPTAKPRGEQVMSRLARFAMG